MLLIALIGGCQGLPAEEAEAGGSSYQPPRSTWTYGGTELPLRVAQHGPELRNGCWVKLAGGGVAPAHEAGRERNRTQNPLLRIAS